MFQEGFKNIYTEDQVDFPMIWRTSSNPQSHKQKTPSSANTILSSIPTLDQIKNTIFAMEDQKVLGPDGFHAIFYKKYWNTVGENVINAITSFFHLRARPKEINSLLIVLIPKTQNPSPINNF